MTSLPPQPFRWDAALMTTRELSAKYHQTEGVIRRWRSSCGISAIAPAVRCFQRTTLTLGQGFLVTSDWHIPYHQPRLVAAVIAAAQTYGVSDVVVVGDFIDFPTISRFDARDIDSNVGMEISAAGDVLHELVDAGLTVHWSRGNHELRFFRALKHQVTIHDLIRMCGVDSESVKGYDTEDLWVSHQGQTWLFTHQQQYNKNPLTVARALHEKYGEINVGTAHNHLYAMGYAPNGKDQLLELGGLFDPAKMAYLNVGGATTYPQQQNGFWVIKHGKVIIP